MGKSLNGKELGKGISQRKDGLYQGRFVNRFGKKQTVYAKTLNEVRQKLRNEQYEDEKSLNVVTKDVTLDEWYQIWMDTCKKNCRESTKTTYAGHYRRVQKALGWRKLTALNLIIIQQAINELDTDNERKNSKKILVDMLDKAIDSDLLIKNAAKQVNTVISKEEKKERRVLTVSETELFLSENTGGFNKMEAYKQEFIEFMVDCQVLKFGEFTLKSGRKSPFFMNAGGYVTGSQLMGLGEYYAKAIHNTYGDDFDVLFGPAYKGIPISVVTAIAYSKLYGKEVRYCSDRKEEKDHGADKGSFLGSKLKDGDRVIMIEDVTTSGKSMEETVPKVKGAADVEIVGLMVSLNRMEKGLGGKMSALDEIKEKYGFEANAIVSMADVIEHLYNKEYNGKVLIDDELKSAIDAYYAEYGI